MRWTRKDLLTMRELDAGEIVLLVDTAASLQEIATREIKKVPALRGKTIVNLFYEPSTRTRTSFEIAGKWLSADVVNFSASGSRTAKGESFVDTAKNIAAMSPDVVVVRHSSAGAAELLLWFEPEPKQGRVSELRVKMAQEAGAQVIVTLCPYCCVNLEDAIKTSGNEGKIEVVDIVELFASRMALPAPASDLAQ